MIVSDLQALQSISNSERGIARYVTEVTRALERNHPDAIDCYLWNDTYPRPAKFDELGLGDKLRAFSEVRGLEVDVLHVNSPFELPNATELLPPIRAHRTMVTCYDLIPLLFPDRYLSDHYASVRYRARLPLIASADAVVTDSRSAADDTIEHLGVADDRVTVIGAGVSSDFRPPTESLEVRMERLRAWLPELSARFVLVPTAMDWRKNTEGAIRAFSLLPAELRARHQLVLFCRLTDDQRARLDRICEDAGVTDRVIITGFVPDDLLVLLYQSAELVMFPTFYEGFGLPVLEARRCGTRVICSRSSSLPEVLADERAFFNPHVFSDIAGAMERALTDPSVAAVLDDVPDPGFTWDEAARLLVGVYHDLASRPGRPDAPPRARRVAVVAEVGLAHTEHAEQNLAFVQHLVDRDDVEPILFAPGERPGQLVGVPCEIDHLVALPYRWQIGDVDEVVYVASDEPSSRPTLRRLGMVPGHLVIDDLITDDPDQPEPQWPVSLKSVTVRTADDAPATIAAATLG